MALTANESNVISMLGHLSGICRSELANLIMVNKFCNGASDYKNTITQEDLDAIPQLDGMTVAQFQNVCYIMGVLATNVEDSIENLVIMSRAAQ